MPHDTNGPTCECGCGEGLPIGSTRRFKRGHRQRYENQRAREITAELRAENNEPAIPPAGDAFDGLSTNWEGIKDPFESLADTLPDDPDPDETARDEKSTPGTPQIITPEGQILVTKKVAQDIQGKIAFLLSMPAAMLTPLDPICFPALQERVPEISARLTPIICQSPDMVTFFCKGTGFILWLSLAVSVWPVVQVIIAHHLTKSIGHDEHGQPVKKDFSQYAA
jgi:hypothetical protein